MPVIASILKVGNFIRSPQAGAPTIPVADTWIVLIKNPPTVAGDFRSGRLLSVHYKPWYYLNNFSAFRVELMRFVIKLKLVLTLKR